LATVDHCVVPNDDVTTEETYAEEWNKPSINMWRVFATFFSFIVVGAIDGAYGVGIFPFHQ